MPLFIAASIVGLLAGLLWIQIGEPWAVLADGSHYMAMYQGQATEAPFAYRIATPFLAHLLPWSAEFNFGVVTVACLSLATGFIALFAQQSGLPVRAIAVVCVLWLTSFAFTYYDTTRVRADGPMLMLLAALFWLSKCRVSAVWLALVLACGALSHETMLIGLAALGIDKLLNTSLTGGRNYGFLAMVAWGVGCLALLLLVRRHTAVAPPTDQSYMDGPYVMLLYTLRYSGGPVKHVMRIYAAYGPALLFAVLWLASQSSNRDRLGFAALFVLAAMATFMATDTLRVMAIIYLPVLFYAAKFIEHIWRERGAAQALALVACQLAYSYLVYGHLRTFKGSHSMNMIAAGLSAVTLALAVQALFWRPARRSVAAIKA